MNLFYKFLEKRNERKLFLKMFPKDLSSDVLEVCKIIPLYEKGHPYLNNRKAHDTVLLTVNTEIIELPYRIYNDEPEEIKTKNLTEKQKIILYCIYTIVPDGYKREKYIKKIIHVKEVWVIPFIIKSLGDYVIEITKFIEVSLEKEENLELYKNFIKNNKKYWEYLKARSISYWDVFHRGKEYRKYKDYPTIKLARLLEEKKPNKATELPKPTTTETDNELDYQLGLKQIKRNTNDLREHKSDLMFGISRCLKEKGLNPDKVAIADYFTEDVAQYYVVCITSERKVFEFYYDWLKADKLSNGTIIEWKDFTENPMSTYMHDSVKIALDNLDEILKQNFYCRVCGVVLDHNPWGEDNKSPDYTFCPKCGVEFGNQDYSNETVKKYRLAHRELFNKEIIIDGNNFSDEAGFDREYKSVLTKDIDWVQPRDQVNLNSFNDFLAGGFGTVLFEEPYKLVWLNSEKSKKDLGKLFDMIIETIKEPDNDHIELVLK